MDADTANQGRIAAEFERLREQGKKALVTFITAGDPGADFTVPAMHGLVAGGANLLELGIPFSDPEAEGPTIQAANERALANGMTLTKVLDMVVEFRTSNSTTPVILMGYLNSVLAMANFANRAKEQASMVDHGESSQEEAAGLRQTLPLRDRFGVADRANDADQRAKEIVAIGERLSVLRFAQRNHGQRPLP